LVAYLLRSSYSINKQKVYFFKRFAPFPALPYPLPVPFLRSKVGSEARQEATLSALSALPALPFLPCASEPKGKGKGLLRRKRDKEAKDREEILY
jgi:hypothetical protein